MIDDHVDRLHAHKMLRRAYTVNCKNGAEFAYISAASTICRRERPEISSSSAQECCLTALAKLSKPAV